MDFFVKKINDFDGYLMNFTIFWEVREFGEKIGVFGKIQLFCAFFVRKFGKVEKKF